MFFSENLFENSLWAEFLLQNKIMGIEIFGRAYIFQKKKYKKNIWGNEKPLKWPNISYLSKITGGLKTIFWRFFGYKIWPKNAFSNRCVTNLRPDSKN